MQELMKLRKPLPSQERLKELFDYDNGDLIWKKQETNAIAVGDRAGCRAGRYWQVQVDGVSYRAHRLIWMWHKGEDPGHHIDHLNGCPTDNRIENLEPVSQRENNVRMWAHKKSSGLPTCVFRSGKKFRARVSRKDLGTFPTSEEASEAVSQWLELSELPQ